MKTTIEIPEKLFRQAKARAALDGLSLREFFLRGLQLALQSPTEPVQHRRIAFPLVRSDGSSSPLTDEMISAALNSDQDLV
jgi:hypothetical protein